MLPNRTLGTFTFGCHFEASDKVLTVRPWDGVGRHVVVRQTGAEFDLSFGRFVELRLDPRKRWFEADIDNSSDKAVKARLVVSGIWGRRVSLDGQESEAPGGKATFVLALPPGRTVTVKGKVLA